MIMEIKESNKWGPCVYQQGQQTAYYVNKMKPQCFDISPCRKIISIGYTNKQLIFWDFVNCQRLTSYPLPFVPAQLFYSDDGNFLLIRPKGSPKFIYLYVIETMRHIMIEALENCFYGKIVEFKAGPHQAIVQGLSDISLIHFDKMTVQEQIDTQSVFVSFTKNNKFIGCMNCKEDIGEIGLRQVKSCKKILKRTFVNLKDGEVNFQISSNTAFIVSSNRSKNRVWSIQTMKLIRKKCYGESSISELNINKQSTLVFFILSKHGIIVWNVSTGRHKIVVKDQKCRLQSIKVVQNCQLIFKRGWQIHSVICN